MPDSDIFPLRFGILEKNDRNGGIWQSGISKSLAKYVERPVCFINVQSSLHENVVFSFCARMDNATYIIFIIRGGKSVATWQPNCQKVFEESGSGRKFLDLSSILSHKQAIR